MSLTFRKRIRLLPFLWLNLGMRGFSVTVGIRPVLFTLGRGGIWFSASLPGTGIGYRQRIGSVDPAMVRVLAWPVVYVLVAAGIGAAWYKGLLPQAWLSPALHVLVIASGVVAFFRYRRGGKQ